MSLKMVIRFIVVLIVLPFSFGAYCTNEQELLDELETASDDSAKIAILQGLSSKIAYSNALKALEYNAKSYAIIRENDTVYFAALLRNYYIQEGILQQMLGNLTTALSNYYRAVDVSEQIYKTNLDDTLYARSLIVLYGNIGIINYHQKNYRKSIEQIMSIIENFSAFVNGFRKANLYNNIGASYLGLEEYDTSLYYYLESLKIFKELNNDRDLSMIYSNLGEVYGKMGHYAKARDYLQKSLVLKEELNDNYGLVNCLVSLAQLNLNLKNYSQSVADAQRVIDICTESNYMVEKRDAYEILAKNSEALKDYKSAFEYYIKFKQVYDSLFSKESNDKFIEMQTRFESKKKEAELKIMHQKEKNELLIRNSLIAGIVVIILVAFMIIRAIMLRRKNEKRFYQFSKKLKEKENEVMRSELEKSELLTNDLNKEINFKTKQLTTHALNMMQKNKMLLELMTTVDTITKQAKPEVKAELQQIKRLIRKNLKTEKDWDVFRLYFEQVNKGFFAKLTQINSSINAYDLRHAALIKLNMNIKETASVLNLSPNSVKSARYRLKKKLMLAAKDDLFGFVRDL